MDGSLIDWLMEGEHFQVHAVDGKVRVQSLEGQLQEELEWEGVPLEYELRPGIRTIGDADSIVHEGKAQLAVKIAEAVDAGDLHRTDLFGEGVISPQMKAATREQHHGQQRKEGRRSHHRHRGAVTSRPH